MPSRRVLRPPPIFANVVTASVACAALASCQRCGPPGATEHDAGPDAARAVSVDAGPAVSGDSSASMDATDAQADALDDAARASGDASGTNVDAGASSCRLLYGPAELAFRGPAALVVSPHELRLVTNDSGKPKIFPVPIAPLTAPAPPPVKPSSFLGVRWPPCEVAGRFAYCPGGGGVVYRTTLGANDGKAVAKNRPGTRVAAAALGPDHTAVATLDMRHTTEGDMLQAFVTLDDGETQRLSEEGAGATSVRMLPRGDGAIAAYLDTRTAMVPVHARPLAMRGAELHVGADAVLFVGGPPERGIDFALGAAGKTVSLLLPSARETIDFGMATVMIPEPLKDDVGVSWSMYPNGIDPAPIGATVGGSDRDVQWIARVVPASKEPGAPRVLELGKVDAKGAFSSMGSIADARHVTDVAMATDGYGAVWILYGDSTVTWLQRRVCNPRE